MDPMKINGFVSPYHITGQYLENRNIKKGAPAATDVSIGGSSFEDILNGKISQKEELKFSKHADNRLSERNITLTEEQLKRLEDGTERARTKGIKESLVLVDDMAFIVSVKNNTVVTAMGKGEYDSVFTNIDGAVII